MANCLRKFLWILTAAASSLFSLYNLRARFPEITVIRMWSIMKNQGDKTTKKMVKRDQIIKIKVQILSTCISWEIQLYLNIFSFYITCAISKKKKNALLLPLDSPLQWDCIWTEACRWRVKLLRSERALACLCMTAAELRSTLALCASNSAPWPDLRKTFVFPNCKSHPWDCKL